MQEPQSEPQPVEHPGVSVSLQRLLNARDQASGLSLHPRHRARATGAGAYLSAFRGRGMEFDQVRAYQTGDDIRNMDWRVTARTGRPHTKLFHEERQRPVFIAVDQGRDMQFGTRVAFKSVIAAEAAALLAWSAADNGDRVGGLVFSEERHVEQRPLGRARGALQFLQCLARPGRPAGNPDHRDAPTLDAALQRLVRIVKPGSLVILISDFRGLGEQSERWLLQLSRHNDLLGIFVHDPLEERAPAPGRYAVSDGRQSTLLDLASRSLREQYRKRFSDHRRQLTALARKARMPLISLRTDLPILDSLRRQGLGASRARTRHAGGRGRP
jgi:uncharacterized protein (DUF58 family)